MKRDIKPDSDPYRLLLEMTEFDSEEVESVLNVWTDGLRLFGLTDAEVAYAAEKHIPEYWDMSLRGVRLFIGALFREVIEMFRMSEYLERGDSVVYCNMPVHPACVYANKVAGGDRIHICQPDYLIASVLEPLFNRSFSTNITSVSCMSADCMHCEMNRYRIEAQMSGMLPSPSVTWNWGLFCNEGPKSEEYLSLMDEYKKWDYVITTFPHDATMGSAEYSDQIRVSYLAGRLRSSQSELTRYTGVTVTDDDVKRAMTGYERYISKLEVLTDLVCRSNPQPLSCNDFTMMCALQHATVNGGIAPFEEALDVLIEEVRERVCTGYGILPSGSARIACHFTPYCIPWFEKIFRENGIAVSYSLFFAPASRQIHCTVNDDVYCDIVRQWLNNPSAVNMGNEVDLVSDILEDNPVDGVVYGFFSFDRWIGGIQKTMARMVESRTGIAHYYLEGDFWNDKRFSMSERLSRIENICYHIKIKHMMNESE